MCDGSSFTSSHNAFIFGITYVLSGEGFTPKNPERLFLGCSKVRSIMVLIPKHDDMDYLSYI
jgi:hypothetical protein